MVFTGDNFHYLKHVRRLSTGSHLQGVDSRGVLYELVICREGPDWLEADFKMLEKSRGPELTIRLYQCLLKGKKNDLVVRQAVEAGVTHFIPVLSQYTIVKLDNKDITGKNTRWQRIVQEAMQQSGNRKLMQLGPPLRLHELTPQEGVSLFCHQQPLGQGSLHSYLAGNPQVVNLLIGPEGGLAEEELSFLKGIGFKPLFLGATVLRAETAALFALAAVKMTLQESEEWRLS